MVHNPYEVEPRKPLTAKQKLKMFIDAKGICCICGGKINHVNQAWDEHVNPLWLNGDNSAPNRAPAHERCARQKTSVEATQRSSIRKKAELYMGARKSKTPMPGSKRSGWKKTFSNGWVRRDDRGGE